MRKSKGWHKFIEKHNFIKVTIKNGEILFKPHFEGIRALIAEVSVAFLAKSIGDNIDPEAMEKMTGIKSHKYLDVKTDLLNSSKTTEVGHETIKATEYFVKNINIVLTDALEDLFIEAVFKSLIKQTEKGNYLFGTTEKELLKQILKIRILDQETRIGITKATGERLNWTASRRQELLKFYKENLLTISKAKKDYRKCRIFLNWRETIKITYPRLPDYVIKSLEESGRDGQPSYLTLKYAATHFGTHSIEYLLKKLKQARREAKQD
jgi:hypothetical protein